MALDFDLIKNSIAYSKKQLIDNKESSACPHLFLLSDFLYPELLEKLLNFISTTHTEWETVIYQENTVRRSITWIPDSVVEEVHMVLESLTDSVNKIFNKQAKFLGINIWKDIHPYSIELHEDNDMVGTAMQIYLSSGPENLNTIFNYNLKTINAIYRKNSGYIMDNSFKIIHGMLTPVPENHIRYSLYATWTNQ